MTGTSNSSPGDHLGRELPLGASLSSPHLFGEPTYTVMKKQPCCHRLSAFRKSMTANQWNCGYTYDILQQLARKSTTCWSLQANTTNTHRISSIIYHSELAWMGCESSKHCTCQAVNRMPVVLKSCQWWKWCEMFTVYVLLWNGPQF